MDSLLDQAPCGFLSLADDGTIVEVNSTLAGLLGYERAALLGVHVQKVFPPGTRIFYQTHIFPMLRMHGGVDEIYVSLRTRDAEDVPMLMNGVRRARDGSHRSDCVFVRMIQRHQLEDQLLQARRLAEEANAAKAKFLSMMSHDLRTPLTAITGYASLLGAGVNGPLSVEQGQSVERIREAARDVLRMINDILAFAKLETGSVEVNLSVLPVAEEVERAVSVIRLRAAEAGIRIETGNFDSMTVRADPGRLRQVLLNLLSNAIKFTPRDGIVSIDCDQVEERVRIRVRDTGVGIAPDQLQSIFEPFVQLDTKIESGDPSGVGLGLAISRDLVMAMNGELTVQSTPGEGAEFTVVLPAR